MARAAALLPMCVVLAAGDTLGAFNISIDKKYCAIFFFGNVNFWMVNLPALIAPKVAGHLKVMLLQLVARLPHI